MRSSILASSAIGLLAQGVAALPATTYGPGLKTLYTMNDLQPNKIIAMPVSPNGTVLRSVAINTGGNGATMYAPDNSGPVLADSLATQDSIVVTGNLLYIVNAGSDSISVFHIDPKDHTNLTMVTPPVKTIGHFPTTIGVSRKHRLVCVGTAGPKNGVECYRSSDHGHLTPDGMGIRPFGIKTQLPPLMNVSSVSDLIFSLDESRLYVPVKGRNAGVGGFVNVYNVERNGTLSTKATRSQPKDTLVLFGGYPIRNSDNIFVTDSGTSGAVILHPEANNTMTTVALGSSTPNIFQGVCWALYSNVSRSTWATSPATPVLLEFDQATSQVISQTNVTNPNQGYLDFVVPGKYIYALASGLSASSRAAIAVVDISVKPPKTVQFYDIGFGANNLAHGLAYKD